MVRFASADLHVHTTASDGTATPREVLDHVVSRTDLAVIAICDHNCVDGAHEAARIASAEDYPIEVVVGQEVETAEGHVLGLWTPSLVAPGTSAAIAVDAIHAQGGLAVVAHPFAPRWWHEHGLERGDRAVYDNVLFDGIECANSTPLLAFANIRARMYRRAHAMRLAATGGSDAHMLSVIGSSRTLFPGSTANDLRQALAARKTRAWGPAFHPLRGVRYAQRVPEIRERDRDRREREIAAGIRPSEGDPRD